MTEEKQPDSRRGLLIGAGLVATMAGTGLGLWMSRRVADGDSVLPQGFWTQQWDAPAGGMVRMSDFRGKPVLINFWATWCPPCIEELPLINAFYTKNKANGWQVLALAVDKTEAVQGFLKKMPLDFPVGVAGLNGAELSRSLGNLAGGLPFTLVLGSDGGVAQRKIGRLNEADLLAWVGIK